MSMYPGPYQSGYVSYLAQPSKPAPPPPAEWPFDVYALMFVAVLSLIGIMPILASKIREMRKPRAQDLHMGPDHVFRSKDELRLWVRFNMGYDVSDSLLDILMTMHSGKHMVLANSRAHGKRTLQEISDAIAAARIKALTSKPSHSKFSVGYELRKKDR